jgi:DNA-binding XRE family transcriptional regulator
VLTSPAPSVRSGWRSIASRCSSRSSTRSHSRPRSAFASVLLALRREFGLSQRDMAALAGMSQPEIARFEAGTVSPTWETAIRLLQAVDARLEVKVKRRGRLVKI